MNDAPMKPITIPIVKGTAFYEEIYGKPKPKRNKKVVPDNRDYYEKISFNLEYAETAITNTSYIRYAFNIHNTKEGPKYWDDIRAESVHSETSISKLRGMIKEYKKIQEKKAANVSPSA